MKDPHSGLREKEQDVERVRKGIQALLTVIPLLADVLPLPPPQLSVPPISATRTSSPKISADVKSWARLVLTTMLFPAASGGKSHAKVKLFRQCQTRTR
jgi:hypothetical protein